MISLARRPPQITPGQITPGQITSGRVRWGVRASAALVLLPCLALAAPASAVEPVERAASTCEPGADLTATGPATGRTLRADDHEDLTGPQLQRIDAQIARAVARRSTGNRKSSPVRVIPAVAVHAHVIDGTRWRGPSRTQVLTQIRILNQAYGGVQSEESAPAGVSFVLRTFHRVRNQRWLNASMFDVADREMRRRLHRGGGNALNVYFSKPKGDPAYGEILGWSSWPWRARSNPLLDGVTINVGSMPGGGFSGYNLGDTAVHEVGHWLGLFHTFQGSCSEENDRVEDTPAEAEPSFACEFGRDSCTAEGLDPVLNFMDYSLDSCMNMFTVGQVARMDENWLAFRAPR